MVYGLALLALSSASCMRGCTFSRPPIHIIPNMDAQPKYEAQEGSDFFYDGGAMRMPVEGTVARGEFYEDEDAPLHTGRDAQGNFIPNPIPVSEDFLARGAERYDIFCRPCHSESGDGQGVLFDQGVPVASYFDERLMNLADGEIFEVITIGKGLMQSYAYAVPVHDRWSIVAHVRRLQEDYRQRAVEQQQLQQQLQRQQ
ncbi:MAG: cytochrome c [Acidobacteriota bacterium]